MEGKRFLDSSMWWNHGLAISSLPLAIEVRLQLGPQDFPSSADLSGPDLIVIDQLEIGGS